MSTPLKNLQLALNQQSPKAANDKILSWKQLYPLVRHERLGRILSAFQPDIQPEWTRRFLLISILRT